MHYPRTDVIAFCLRDTIEICLKKTKKNHRIPPRNTVRTYLSFKRPPHHPPNTINLFSSFSSENRFADIFGTRFGVQRE